MDANTWAERQLKLVELASSVIINELLFCVFWYLNHWNRPLSLEKLMRHLDADQKILKHNLNLLLRCQLIEKKGQKYALSKLGKEAVQFIEVAVRKTASKIDFTSDSLDDGYMEIIAHNEFSAPFPNVAEAAGKAVGTSIAEAVGTSDVKLRTASKIEKDLVISISDSLVDVFFGGEQVASDAT